MRYSTLFGRSTHGSIAHADAVSHDLLERAGYIRQHAAGIYTYLHLGLRSLRRIERIVRDEMDRTGAQEILMPMVHDAGVWRQTGRYDAIDATLARFSDRHGRALVLGMTHEEIVAELAAAELQSYRQLDTVVYQIQTKFRDEARARGGLLRTREFLMKDAYSLHLDADGLEATYQIQAAAYHRIFRRVGLGDVQMVESATGDMGGLRAHEFIAFLDVGEDVVAVCDRCGHAANIEALSASVDRCTHCDGGLTRRRGVEVGNIFQLGTRYTDALGVRVTDDTGQRRSVLMDRTGSASVGCSRVSSSDTTMSAGSRSRRRRRPLMRTSSFSGATAERSVGSRPHSRVLRHRSVVPCSGTIGPS